VGTGRRNAMMDLEEVVQRKLAGLRPNGYEEVVCIGYDLPTGSFDPSKRNPVDNRLGVVYRGDDDDLQDIRGRAQDLKRVIRHAYANYRLSLGRVDPYALARLGNHRSVLAEPFKRLKLFMVPEFYFRGKNGAYAIERLWDVLPEMRAETQKHKYAD